MILLNQLRLPVCLICWLLASTGASLESAEQFKNIRGALLAADDVTAPRIQQLTAEGMTAVVVMLGTTAAELGSIEQRSRQRSRTARSRACHGLES